MNDAAPTHQDDVATVAELVEQARTCMLTTMTADARHVSRPMVVQEVEFDGDLWFFCHDDSAKIAEIRLHPQVNVAFADEQHSSWTSIAGRATVVHDRAKAEELWSKPLEVWFEDGLDTATLALLRVEADSAEYWDSSNSRVKKIVGGLRAAVTKNPDAFPADNRTVDL